MTEVRYLFNDGIYIEISGHNSYVNKVTGNVDICVVISTLVIMLTIALADEELAPEPVIDGYFRMDIKNPSEKVSTLAHSVIDTLKFIEEKHKEYITVKNMGAR